MGNRCYLLCCLSLFHHRLLSSQHLTVFVSCIFHLFVDLLMIFLNPIDESKIFWNCCQFYSFLYHMVPEQCLAYSRCSKIWIAWILSLKHLSQGVSVILSHFSQRCLQVTCANGWLHILTVSLLSMDTIYFMKGFPSLPKCVSIPHLMQKVRWQGSGLSLRD